MLLLEVIFEVEFSSYIRMLVAFESPTCMVLSDINGNVISSFKNRIPKALLDLFKIAFGICRSLPFYDCEMNVRVKLDDT